MSAGLSEPGFADPVRDCQIVFRAVLDAMARPGQVHAVTAPARPPSPLDRATAAVVLTLADADSPIWLDSAAAAARDWIAFHCGAPQVAPGEAQFAVAIRSPAIAAFAAGSDEEPERSCTVILQVATLGEGHALRLSGPGLERPQRLGVGGLPDDFVAQWDANRRLFPRGVDLILTAGDRLAALPRTVTVEAG